MVMLRTLVDGLVFENDSQIGIWRTFYEVMTRLSDQIDYTLWLRSSGVQTLPPRVRLVSDSGRRHVREGTLWVARGDDGSGPGNRKGFPRLTSIIQPTLRPALSRACRWWLRFMT